ncbi:hypothetical protein Esti_003732 [Eimeria stiedai]
MRGCCLSFRLPALLHSTPVLVPLPSNAAQAAAAAVDAAAAARFSSFSRGAAAAGTAAAAAKAASRSSRAAAVDGGSPTQAAAQAAAAAAAAATPAASTMPAAAAAAAAGTAAAGAAPAAGEVWGPFLARPFIALNGDSFQLEMQASWWNPQQAAFASRLFSLRVTAHPVLVAQTLHRLPQRSFPQVAFVGHSNCGKSSLINGLLFGREVARISRVAGRTRQLFTFDLGRQLSLVDLPGYGFAKVSGEMRKDWALLVEEYLRRSTQLRRVLSLVDLMAGVRPLDIQLWQLLADKQIPFQVVATKADLLTAPQLHRFMLKLQNQLQQLRCKYLEGFVFAVSAKHNLGLRQLRCCLSALAGAPERKRRPTQTLQ